MKKVLLTAMAILTLASTSVFGMYGYGDSWIDFLTHGNQFRARMDQLGFVLGNGTIKGTFGLRANTGWMGQIIGTSPVTGADAFIPTVSGGIGYTSDMISVGVGYNYTYISKVNQIHTPVFMLNALNNNLRIAVPIQVSVYEGDDPSFGTGLKGKYTSVAFNNIQLRYYTGIDAFNAVRFYVYYKNDTAEVKDQDMKMASERLGFQLRLYFLNTQIGNVTVNPFIRAEFHTALKGYNLEGYDAKFAYDTRVGKNGTVETKQSDIYDVSPYRIKIQPVLSLAANSDIVSLYFEPSLGYSYTYWKKKPVAVGAEAEEVAEHSLVWGAYAEMYIRPVQDLEWYFEMDVQGNTAKSE